MHVSGGVDICFLSKSHSARQVMTNPNDGWIKRVCRFSVLNKDKVRPAPIINKVLLGFDGWEKLRL